MALLEAYHLNKRFGDRVVLADLSLSFEEGQLSGIMGPNGAGKSTCFEVLTGSLPPDRGRVVLDGQDITGLSPWRIARRGVLRCFQTPSLFDDLTVLESLLFAVPETRGRGSSPFRRAGVERAALDKAAQVASLVGLSHQLDVPAEHLSFGERRVLEIALTLAAEPRVLLLDEPAQGLDPEARARLRDLIRALKGRVTIVMIEHDASFLFELADRVSVVHWGQVIAQGAPERLRADPWAKRAGLGAANA